jgi:hypothetical protein
MRVLIPLLVLMALFPVAAWACSGAGERVADEVGSAQTSPTTHEADETPAATITSAPASATATFSPTRQPTATPTPEPQLTVVEYGFVVLAPNSLGDQYAPWVIVLRNDASKGATDIEVRVLLYDDTGVLVGSDTKTLPLVFPTTTVAVASDFTDVSSAPSRMEYRIEEVTFTDVRTNLGIDTSEGIFTQDRFSSSVTFSATNNYDVDLESVETICVLKDSASQYLGIATARIEFMPAGTTATGECTFFDDDITAPESVASVNVYAAFSLSTVFALDE